MTKDDAEADYTKSFGKVTFTKAGTYQWTVTEAHAGEAIDGVSYDSAPRTVTITVVDDGRGGLVAGEGSALVQTAEFENTYSKEGEGEVKVLKNLVGRAWTTDDSFVFTISAAEGTPMPSKTTVTVTKDSANYIESFGRIEFAEAGTYAYTVSEARKGETIKGVTYDPEDKTVTIKVKDDGKGNLVADGTAVVQTASFENTYSKSGEGEVKVQKVLDGRDWTDDDRFAFTLTPANADTPMPAKSQIEITKADADQTKSFGKIRFTEAGTYKYTVKETKGDAKGVTYDEADHVVTIEVVDDGEGNLVADKGGQLIQTTTVTNKYVAEGKAHLEAAKAIQGAGWPEGGEVTFAVASDDTTKLPENETVTLTEAGRADFGDISYDKGDAGRTYVYTITETANDKFGSGWTSDPKVITATVKVGADKGDGTLGEATVTYSPEDATVTNTYSADGKAVLKARKAGNARLGDRTFRFRLTRPDGTTQTSDAVAQGEEVAFDEIAYALADAGKEYEYTIEEVIPSGAEERDGKWVKDGVTYDDSKQTVKVKVIDDGTGSLKVRYNDSDTLVVPEFENEYEARGEAVLKAKKAVNANLGDRKFRFQLLDSGNHVLQTSDEVGQGETWEFAPVAYDLGDAGKTFTYRIREALPEAATAENGYTAGGVTYDPSVKTVNVRVADNGDGTLGVTYDDSPTLVAPEFRNSYRAEGEGEVKAKKTLTGRDWDTEDSFEFTITPVGDAPAFENDTVTVTSADSEAKYTKSFGKVTFTKVGTYTYTVSEAHKGEVIDGVSYDTADKTVTIKVKRPRRRRHPARADRRVRELLLEEGRGRGQGAEGPRRPRLDRR